MGSDARAASPRPSTRRKWLDFDIDDAFSRFIQPSFVHRLPQPVAHFLGYRSRPSSHVPHLAVLLWAFFGSFVGISLLAGVERLSPWIQSLNPPLIIASYGAAAILEYNAIESPLGQPRNMILGQFFSATLGVCVTKLFALLSPAQFNDLRWLAGALCVAFASVVMGATKTIHPPAGATALLAAVDPQITAMGWSFIPLVLISDLLMLGSACLLNNLQRRYPQYWWTPKVIRAPSIRANSPEMKASAPSSDDSDRTSGYESAVSALDMPMAHEVRVTSHDVDLPDWLELNDIEVDLLRVIQGRLRGGLLSRSTTQYSRHSRQSRPSFSA